MKHVLKIQCKYLMEILYEGKSFEIRKDDRGYKVGDIIHFVDPNGKEFPSFWRKVSFRITYTLRDVPQYGLDTASHIEDFEYLCSVSSRRAELHKQIEALKTAIVRNLEVIDDEERRSQENSHQE